MANEGMNKLARVIGSRIQGDREANSSLVLDFGVIQSDYSLLTNTYPIPIPKADYLVCRQLTLGATGSTLTGTTSIGTHEHDGNGSHSHTEGTHSGHTEGNGVHTHNGGTHGHGEAGQHSHSVLISEKIRWIKPGDRVLVAWVQYDAIVVDIICNATDVG